MVLLYDQPQLSALKMPPAPLGPSPTSTAYPSNSPFGPIMPGGDMALLLKADEALRQHQGLASFAPVARVVAAAATVPFVHPPAGHRHLAHMGGLPCEQEEPQPAGALGPLAEHPFTNVQPGVTAARVGLLPGLRTSEMLKFNGVRPWGIGCTCVCVCLTDKQVPSFY